MGKPTQLVPVAIRPGIQAHLGENHVVIHTNGNYPWMVDDWALVALDSIGLRWNKLPVTHALHVDTGDEYWTFTLPDNNTTTEHTNDEEGG